MPKSVPKTERLNYNSVVATFWTRLEPYMLPEKLEACARRAACSICEPQVQACDLCLHSRGKGLLDLFTPPQQPALELKIDSRVKLLAL